MRLLLASLLSFSVAMLAAPSAHAQSAPPTQGLVGVVVARDDGPVRGSGVLIHRERRDGQTVLYVLTSARLFGPLSSHGVRPSTTLTLEGGRVVTLRAEDVLLPVPGTSVNVAVLKAVVPDTTLVPQPVVFDSPMRGTPFWIVGFGSGGSTDRVLQRVGALTATALVGDGGTRGLDRCIGAPAFSDAGVFGIVTTSCDDPVPSVTLLPYARSFVMRYVTGLVPATPPSPAIQLSARELLGPVVDVPCNATETRDLEVPFTLTPLETAIDATASVVKPQGIRLADVHVLNLGGRSVTLRLTLGGATPTPQLPPETCPKGQALVSVHLEVLTTAR